MSEKTISVKSPLDGRLLKTYRVTSAGDIDRAVKTSRLAGERWAAMDVERRLEALMPLKQLLLERIDSISERLIEVTGKTKTDVLLGEIYPLLDMLSYYRKNSAGILAPRQVATSPLAFPDATANYTYRPYGVAAVISPWNYPLQLTLYPLLTALIAGNGVVFKTSEASLPVGDLIVELLAMLDLPKGLVHCVIGGPECGRQLIECRPDLVFFTGGLQAGRSVMNSAARHPIPVILELGGKDAMIVCADADLERAVNAALYGAFVNSGQVCVAVERLYVEEPVYQDFVERLCAATALLKYGSGDHCDLGAISTPGQIDVVESHYRDAMSRGAKASGPFKRDGAFVQPLVLWDVDHDMRVMKEETFGPLLPVMPFGDEGEVLAWVNADQSGLNASVWSRNEDKARRIADRLKVGNWAVNDVLKNIGHSGLPFGGVGNSGFGRYHGAEGLRSFTCTVSGVVSLSRNKREPNWFPYTEQNYLALRGFIDFLYGEGSLPDRVKRNWRQLRTFQQYAGLNLHQHWRNFLIFISRRQH